MAETQIEWTDATWNPVVGCSIVTAGCTHCYAMEMARRLEARPARRRRKGRLFHLSFVLKRSLWSLTTGLPHDGAARCYFMPLLVIIATMSG